MMARGYTLIELGVVILIIAIVFMVAAPRLAPFLTATRLDSSARQLATFCRYLNAHAVLTKSYFTLHMDTKGGEYWVTAYTSETGASVPREGEKVEGEVEEVEVRNDLLRRTKLREGVRFEDVRLSQTGGTDSGEAIVDFTPVGPTQKILVHLVDERKAQVTVYFDPVTGNSGVLDGYVESVDEWSLMRTSGSS